MTAQTTAQRKAAERARKTAAGLARVPDLWAHPDDHATIREYVQRLNRKRIDPPR